MGWGPGRSYVTGSKEEVPWEDDIAQGEDESAKRIRQNR